MFIYTFLSYTITGICIRSAEIDCKKLGRPVGMCETHTIAVNYSFPIVTGVSQGPDLASKP